MQNATPKVLYITNFLLNTKYKYYVFIFSSVDNSVSASSLLFCSFVNIWEISGNQNYYNLSQQQCSEFAATRFFRRITQKGQSRNVSGRINLQQKLGQIFPEWPKGGRMLKCFVSSIFPYETFLDFSQILVLVWFFKNLVMIWWNWIKYAIFSKGLNF